ncbi:hypothetical protein CKA34_01790 [Rhizobium sp. 11515TR]|nr:hypothetical protein CKA34_01790 [Rhizobium sp. 11515TR]
MKVEPARQAKEDNRVHQGLKTISPLSAGFDNENVLSRSCDLIQTFDPSFVLTGERIQIQACFL